jgi:hypothetical protein
MNKLKLSIIKAIAESNRDYNGYAAYIDKVFLKLTLKGDADMSQDKLRTLLYELVEDGYITISDDRFRQIKFKKKVKKVFPYVEDYINYDLL